MSDAVTPTPVDADTVGDIPEVKMDVVPLTLADRCDRCGAQAFVRVEFVEGSLMFCGHHFRKNEDVLRERAIFVQDELDKINLKPSLSANAL